MKIVFLQDVKGKGKKGEIKEVPAGYGQFLIKAKQAEEATTKTLNRLQRENDAAAALYAQDVQNAKDLAGRLQKLKVITHVRVGENGRVFGSVASKQIVENLATQHDIKIDKHALILEHPIQGIGDAQVKVKLHKEVMATITVEVVPE